MDQKVLDEVLRDWERWAAELLESQISYPVLTFFRSQHSNQSWLGALTTMLDVTSLVLTGIEGVHPGQAKLTFAMARHAAVDLAQVVNARYDPAAEDRLPDADLDGLRDALVAAGLRLRNDEYARDKLAKLRSMYEPYVHSIARNLMLTLPPWRHSAEDARQLAGRTVGSAHSGAGAGSAGGKASGAIATATRRRPLLRPWIDLLACVLTSYFPIQA